MHAELGLDLAFDRQHGDQHDQPFGILEGAAMRAIAGQFGKAGGPQHFEKIGFGLLDPLWIKFGNS